jgi:uncharacterized protein YcnI
MRTIASTSSVLAALGCLLSAGLAHAHVGASTPTPYANATAETTFAVGHGCEGVDTQSVKINIPAGVTSLRVVESYPFTSVTTEKDAAGTVTSVTFSKPQSTVREGDDGFYKLSLRFKLPDKPFTVLYFPTIQTCKKPDGTGPAPTEWIGTTPNEGETGPEPAPALLLLPTRTPGWNKYTLPAGVTFTKEQLATVFKDAQIVWAGTKAYSINPNTAAQIAAEDGVEALESLAAGTEIWVKY